MSRQPKVGRFSLLALNLEIVTRLGDGYKLLGRVDYFKR